MTGLIKKAVLGTAMAASAVVASTPADAQYYRGRHHGGGDTAAAAILGGIVGLGVGAAIASNNGRDRYYDRRAYNGYRYDGYYQQPRGYYYDDYAYQPRCYIERRYDRWNGGVYNVRVCR